MKIGIIKTDNGEHSPEVMASACAGNIMNIDPSKMDGPRLMAAQRLELAIVEALVPHHAATRDATKAELQTDATAHFARADLHDPGDRLEQAVADVQAAAAGTPWEDQFMHPEGVAVLRGRIGQFLVDMAHLERLYHRDRNPGDALAAAYAAQPTGIAVVPVSAEG